MNLEVIRLEVFHNISHLKIIRLDKIANLRNSLMLIIKIKVIIMIYQICQKLNHLQILNYQLL